MYPLKLKEWRQSFGITQTELAERSGVTLRNIAYLGRIGKHVDAVPSRVWIGLS